MIYFIYILGNFYCRIGNLWPCA